MDVPQLFNPFLFTPNIEIVKAALPEMDRLTINARKSKTPYQRYLKSLHDHRRIGHYGLANQ
jgi:hypothetical protein